MTLRGSTTATVRAMLTGMPARAVVLPAEGGPYHCPCCGYLTLPARGGYDICPVCFWEDDGQDDEHADEVWGGPNGSQSLTDARQHFDAHGACTERSRSFVRPPRPDEQPRRR